MLLPRLLILLVLAVGPVAAQLPDTTLLSGTRADLLTGLYVFEDGRLAQVMDLRDQLGGRPTLSVVEYASGRLRGLYPVASGAFEAGTAWFRRDSVTYVVRFDEAAGRAMHLTWDEAGRSVRGRRAPLVEREVSITNNEVTLAGTLILPAGPGPHPAVIMVPGSGPLTRRTPRYAGDLLAWHGIAVLSMDKRGTGGSTGQWLALGHAEWATDVEAQLDFLHTVPEIDDDRLGLIAGSEGGFVAPVVAARRPDVRFLVCRVCSALPHPRVIVDMETGTLRRRGMADADVAKAGELLDRLMRYALERTGYDSLVAFADAGTGAPWRSVFPMQRIPAPDAAYWDRYRGVLVVDPREQYARLSIPVLTILGERDERILVERHRPVFETLADAGVDISTWVIPDASHGLLVPGDAPTEQQYPAGFHDRIVQWVVARATRVETPRPPDSCGVGAPIPAYAHNDYQNPRPLFDALALGYQGVEADFHLVRGMLLVAHDRGAVRSGRTLESMYLEPLRAWVTRCGTVLPDGKPFLLTIEAKTRGIDAYRALVRVLHPYRDILTVVRDGTEHTGPVQVVLVGWYPPLADLEAEPERLVGVQWYADADTVPAVPAHLIRLVSVDYGNSIGWDGSGIPPADAARVLERLVAARDAVPGRIARVHNVPVDPAVYRSVLAAGVDLIGTQDLRATRALLTSP